MSFVSATKNNFSVKAYIGDKKTLLAFNFAGQDSAKNLAGFSIFCQPPGNVPGYYLTNTLRFENPANHKQVAGEPPNSSVNAPIQRYRWTHYLGSVHQGLAPLLGDYTYTVTPRYFDAQGSMQGLDPSLSAPVTVPVGPFKKGCLTLGFTRGYMQSEGFVHHFGKNTPVAPKGKQFEFDTNTQAGTDNGGQPVTFAQIYEWMGETAREQVFNVINTVLNDSGLALDMFAYDFNEPDVAKIMLELAGQGRLRVILDNAALHVTQKGATVKTTEDQFADLFDQQKKDGSELLRGCFARYSHDKVFIVKNKSGQAIKVLTGSTNFSVTGLYVNANHVLVFDDANVAGHYARVFEESWQVLSKNKSPSKAAADAFSSNALATQAYASESGFVPKMSVTFSPHSDADVTRILGGVSSRVTQEAQAANGNVIFAVMQLTGSQSPVYKTLGELHATQSLYSYGISDAPQGVFLYAPGKATGVQVTGKPGQVTLPPPFDQVPSPPGHEIHDKFVVCGLNGKDPVVYCGSSNLASGGEAANGDNLLEIHDADVATAFAIEALGLVDHYNFLDRMANPKNAAPAGAQKPAAGKKSGSKAGAKKAAAKAPAAKAGAKKAAVKKSGAKAGAKKAAAKKSGAKAGGKKAAAKKSDTKAGGKKAAANKSRVKAGGKKSAAKKKPGARR
ncbi:MAG TPA: phospholipase D-like domain-containing protein [Blastocatellia bacterium]|nr:phospholipase D-like domain-containing protein [Blastocatellia bacterium]